MEDNRDLGGESLVAAQIFNRSVIAQIELERMKVANYAEQQKGKELIYTAEDFADLIDELTNSVDELLENEE